MLLSLSNMFPFELFSVDPDFKEILFFDNEISNIRDCSTLGIICKYTPHGLTRQAWEEGLRQYTEAQKQ